MVISEDQSDVRYQIKAYDPGCITVNNISYTKSLIISGDQLITNWPPQSLTELLPEHWQPIIDLKPEIILLGTGKSFSMPAHALLAVVYDANIGIESMSTAAACHTYTALTAENRRVVAALLIN